MGPDRNEYDVDVANNNRIRNDRSFCANGVVDIRSPRSLIRQLGLLFVPNPLINLMSGRSAID